ncbi:V-type ATP synthase subunit F [Promethearchaeum syntrophicum]|uniref:V-type ATP synthase subunit F n=1 Tax=Promethearchaeum syntrophicum TaxID=2594042 RepID=A0A5B9DA53_9ARCH|nr:V-type ATP synthase subunit F [Candidatus Prometheoarchaeum syntrophicum]QEE15871.1 V-type ATP synthase subunit F [Candidatus Prometheoarchaeum syntrophicum]
MKIVSVGDEHLNLMFSLIGITGFEITTEDEDELKEQFNEILRDKDIGLIIISEKFLIRFKGFFTSLKKQKSPIIIEVPDIKGTLDFNYFQQFIQKYIGLI